MSRENGEGKNKFYKQSVNQNRRPMNRQLPPPKLEYYQGGKSRQKLPKQVPMGANKIHKRTERIVNYPPVSPDFSYQQAPPPMGTRTLRKQKQHRLRKIFIRTFLIVFLLLFLGAGGAFAAFKYYTKDMKRETVDETVLKVNTEKQIKSVEMKIKNIAVFGVDSRNGENVGNSDAIMIVSIDGNKGKVKMVSIARDTYVNIPKYGKTKITGMGGIIHVLTTYANGVETDIKPDELLMKENANKITYTTKETVPNKPVTKEHLILDVDNEGFNAKGKTYQNVVINARDASLSNIVVQEDITLKENIKNSGATLTNVTAKDIAIYGGKEASAHQHPGGGQARGQGQGPGNRADAN